MSTSGSIDWTVTRDQIIKRGYEIPGRVAEDEQLTTTQIANGASILTSMTKSWQAERIFLWKMSWETATMSASSEVTGSDSNIYTCVRNHTSSSDNKPITGPNWTTYWKLAGSTGGTWVTATSYTAIGHISLTDVLQITQAFWRTDSNDVPLRIISKEEYLEQSSKGTTGQPTLLYFDQSSLNNPKVFLWPQPDVDVSVDLSEVLHYNAIKRVEDFDSGLDNPDFDVKWIETLAFNLGYKLSFGTGISSREMLLIKDEAETLKKAVMNDSTESLDMEILPRIRN